MPSAATAPAPPSQTLLTAAEVAALVRVTVPTVRGWAKAGRFPRRLRVGERLLWRPEVATEFLASREEAARQQAPV
jgi:predicted DNA-binding transcriptional regulator AlpA